MDSKIIERVMCIVKKNSKVQTTCILEFNTNLVNDFGFDSIDLVKLVSEIENEFHIIFNMEDLDIENITYLNNIVSLINEKTIT